MLAFIPVDRDSGELFLDIGYNRADCLILESINEGTTRVIHTHRSPRSALWGLMHSFFVNEHLRSGTNVLLELAASPLVERALRGDLRYVAEWKDSVGERPYHSNFSDRNSVKILSEFRKIPQNSSETLCVIQKVAEF